MILRHQESYNSQILIGVGLVGLLLASLFFVGPSVREGRKVMGGEDVSYSYEMARIEPEEGPFDLSDRSVQRRKRELEALEVKAKPAASGPTAGSGALKNAHAAKPNTKNTALKPALSPAEAARLRVRNQAEGDRFRRIKGAVGAAAVSSPPAAPQYYAALPAKPTAGNPFEKKEEEPKLTIAQWRSLLQLSPSSANVAKFVAARANGEIDDASVLDITKDLLRDSSDERQKAGLAILDRFSSAKSFDFMVTTKTDYSQNVQTSLQKKIESYALPARLVFLGPVLSSVAEDKTAVLVAMELINVAVTEYKRVASGQIAQSTGAPSLAQLRLFVTTLKRVGETGEGNVAQQAQQLNAAIGELKPIPVKPLTGRGTQTAQNDR